MSEEEKKDDHLQASAEDSTPEAEAEQPKTEECPDTPPEKKEREKKGQDINPEARPTEEDSCCSSEDKEKCCEDEETCCGGHGDHHDSPVAVEGEKCGCGRLLTVFVVAILIGIFVCYPIAYQAGKRAEEKSIADQIEQARNEVQVQVTKLQQQLDQERELRRKDLQSATERERTRAEKHRDELRGLLNEHKNSLEVLKNQIEKAVQDAENRLNSEKPDTGS